jgi:CRP/FNR family cyclic AMP-dependent transcriptional regulator
MKTRKSLEEMRILGSLDAAEIAALNLRCHWRRVQSKEWLLHQDHVGTDAYFLTDGALRTIINTPGGSDVILTDLKAGDYFGEMPAIDGQPQSAGIVAISDATVACMPASVFRQVLHEHPEVMERVLRDFVSRMRSLHLRVSELHTMPVRHRIYAELLRRSRADPIDERRGVVSPVPRHAELAARVGTRRETVARELKALERAGIFTKSGGAFLITGREIEPELQPRRRVC